MGASVPADLGTELGHQPGLVLIGFRAQRRADPLLGPKVAEAVFAAHQHGGAWRRANLGPHIADMRGDIADPEAEAPISGPIRVRAMYEAGVV